MRGREAERELVKKLREKGFKAVRIPASNPSAEPLPDVFATKGDVLLAIEVKSTWEKKVKVREEQVKKLFDFLSFFPLNGMALVVGKFKRRRWTVRVVEKVEDIIISEDDEDLDMFIQKLFKQ
ncbi:MAG: Holliday junction resolvase Hjc [Metallosphaera sp.]